MLDLYNEGDTGTVVAHWYVTIEDALRPGPHGHDAHIISYLRSLLNDIRGQTDTPGHPLGLWITEAPNMIKTHPATYVQAPGTLRVELMANYTSRLIAHTLGGLTVYALWRLMGQHDNPIHIAFTASETTNIAHYTRCLETLDTTSHSAPYESRSRYLFLVLQVPHWRSSTRYITIPIRLPDVYLAVTDLSGTSDEVEGRAAHTGHEDGATLRLGRGS